MKSDNDLGLFEKFTVKRIDGKLEKEDARYFVLDYANDPDAAHALRIYAMRVKYDKPKLYRNLMYHLDLLKSIGKGEALES